MTMPLTSGAGDDEEGKSRRWVVYPYREITSSPGDSRYAWLTSLRLEEFYWPNGEPPPYRAPSIDPPDRKHDVNVNRIPRPILLVDGPADAEFIAHLGDCPANPQARVPAKRRWRARGLHRRAPATARLVVRCSCILKQGLPALKSGPSPQSLTGAAVFIAGRAHCEMRDEWKSHLAGEDGKGLARNLAVRAAWGFIWSAVRYRLRDATGLICRPLDVVLRSRGLSTVVVWVPTLGVAVVIVRHDGLYGLVTNDTNLSAMVTFIYAAIRVGRWRRRVTPKPRPERVDE
jgi:hypothetical protein